MRGTISRNDQKSVDCFCRQRFGHYCFRVFIAYVLCFTVGFSHAQPNFGANWESLDKHETPQWWQNGKFGIFIHWGVYSVPSYTQLGQYAEWYWQHKDKEHSPSNTLRREIQGNINKFHNVTYGDDFHYQDFANQFTAELFEPNDWAVILKNSGAKYVVLTSKHHDGFCLWPNDHANRIWGRKWNSMDIGPRRDILGELTQSVRNQGLKMGIYYSLYEWFNPMYLLDKEKYVDEHMIPQFKEVVEKYAPSIIFSDGEWEASDKFWKSEEIVSWLYNESASKDDIVINDRWGGDTRHNHGDYFTTEYGAGLPNANHLWEESRGMAYSYGYNRVENLEDYRTSQELILMLIDIVSRGGNFLLNIGPTADGRIPVIMQQRLSDIGRWLKVNGEAIYGTHTWIRSEQWSEGEQYIVTGGHYMVKDYNIEKLTINPDPGKAVKEVFFTSKPGVLFAILPKYPKADLVIDDIELTKGTRIQLLGYDSALEYKYKNNTLSIKLPEMAFVQDLPNQAFVVKLILEE